MNRPRFVNAYLINKTPFRINNLLGIVEDDTFSRDTKLKGEDMDYPIWDLAMGGGLLMALVAIPHVIVAHFAVGGGLLIAVTETLAVKRDGLHDLIADRVHRT